MLQWDYYMAQIDEYHIHIRVLKRPFVNGSASFLGGCLF